MSDFDFAAKLRTLALARQRNFDNTRAQDELIDRLYNSPRWKALEQVREQSAKEEDQLDEEIRAAAEAHFKATQDKHPIASVNVRVIKDFEYDEAAAIEWCKANVAAAVQVTTKLNISLFKKTVEALKDKRPAFVTINEVPQGTIADDLREYLPKEE